MVDIRAVVPGIAQDIRYFGNDNFVGTRVDGYQAPRCWLKREAAEALASYPLIMSDKTNITVSEIRGMVKDADRELKRMGNSVKVVVIDYLKFIRATDRYAGQRVNEGFIPA